MLSSVEIENTQPQKIFITTTGISKQEIHLIKSVIPPHFIFQDRLSTTTTYLLTYKCFLTPKYFQAIKWKIPVLKVKFAYDGAKKKLKIFENLFFSTSEISNDIFKNFLIVQGAVFREEVERSTQLLLSTSNKTEKVEFCDHHGIPVVDPNSIFEPDLATFLNFQSKIFALKKHKIFSGKIFLIDKNLHPLIFNKLKRLIIENDGTRVSVLDSAVDFVLSDEDFLKSKTPVYFYQFVFDCVENESLLLPNSYLICTSQKNDILENVVCALGADLDDAKKIVTAKLAAMGARVRSKLGPPCNYLIVKNKGIERKDVRQKIVTAEWVDQCLYALKKVRDEKYLVAPEIANVLGSAVGHSVKFLTKKTVKIFQFTGLPTFFKNKAIKLFEDFNLKYFDSEEYFKCTHLIMGKISTSEKFLSALANGAWILQPNFLDDYDNSENFNYEKYEWKVEPGMSQTDSKLIECVKKWRLRVLETGKPAFYGWVVKIKGDPVKVESYKRVLSAGGAVITEGEDYNKCFVTKGCVFERWKSTDYIFAYLFKKD